MSASDPNLKLLTLAQAADLLGVPESTIERWIADGRLPHARLADGHVLIPQGALMASIDAIYDLRSELVALETSFAHLDESQIQAALDTNNIAEHDVVALRDQVGTWPAGTIGTGVNVYPEVALVEVSEDAPPGRTLDTFVVPLDKLELRWQSNAH